MNIPIPIKIGSKMGGEFTYPGIPLVLTHIQMSVPEVHPIPVTTKRTRSTGAEHPKKQARNMPNPPNSPGVFFLSGTHFPVARFFSRGCFFSTIVLFKNRSPFYPGFWRFSRKIRIPWFRMGAGRSPLLKLDTNLQESSWDPKVVEPHEAVFFLGKVPLNGFP